MLYIKKKKQQLLFNDKIIFQSSLFQMAIKKNVVISSSLYIL